MKAVPFIYIPGRDPNDFITDCCISIIQGIPLPSHWEPQPKDVFKNVST